MFNRVASATINGLEPEIVNVEVDVNTGLPGFDMCGFLSSEVKESRERVRIAVKNIGIRLGPQKITVNMSPADIRKSGTGFDLPIAIGVLASNQYISSESLKDTFLIGELSLNGNVNYVKGVLPAICKAKEEGFKRCIVPSANEFEGAVIDEIDVIGVNTLAEAMDFLNEKVALRPVQHKNFDEICAGKQIEQKNDFSEIKGQAAAKRATLIAAAGMHNIMYIGAPGSGKTMMAKRIPTILPDLTFEESLEISKIYSVAGLLDAKNILLTQRPFRSPHHTVTSAALIGGGKVPVPGEITLADRGVLFLDELTEFYSNTMESLRQPLEDKKVTIVRLNAAYTYPSEFMLVAAINPCKCGYYPDRNICNCSEYDINRYLGKISQPFWDRFDLCVETSKMQFRDLAQVTDTVRSYQGRSICETSGQMKEKVQKAIAFQKDRYKNKKITFNSELSMTQIKKYCVLGRQESAFMEKAFDKMNLTARGYHKILKTARTIADLEQEEKIQVSHLAEAVSYRSYDTTVHAMR